MRLSRPVLITALACSLAFAGGAPALANEPPPPPGGGGGAPPPPPPGGGGGAPAPLPPGGGGGGAPPLRLLVVAVATSLPAEHPRVIRADRVDRVVLGWARW